MSPTKGGLGIITFDCLALVCLFYLFGLLAYFLLTKASAMTDTVELQRRPVVIRECEEDGTPPVLLPGEAYKDDTHGLWHFCTPDGTHFCAGSKDSQVSEHRKRGITIVGHIPTHAGSGKYNRKGQCGVVANVWTVSLSMWEKVTEEKDNGDHD